MNVRVNIRLSVPAADKHLGVMRSAAGDLTDDPGSVSIGVAEKDEQTVFAEFTIPKARQADVVDGIAKRFAMFMENFADQSIGFPSMGSKRRAQQRPEPYR